MWSPGALQHTERRLLHAILKLTPKDLVTNFSSAPGQGAETEVLGNVALEVFRFLVQTKLGWQIILKSY